MLQGSEMLDYLECTFSRNAAVMYITALCDVTKK